MNYTCIGFGIVFMAAGLLFALRKLLPRAWKRMSDSEKAKIRIKPLCINIGIMIMLCGAILLVRGFCQAFTGKAFIITMIGWLVLCGIDLFFISRSKRYRNDN